MDSSTVNGAHRWMPGESLRHAIERSGFQINMQKTRMQYRTSRQEVTGLIVNQRIGVPRDYRRRVRAMVHRFITTGEFLVPCVAPNDDGETKGGRQGTRNELHGMLGFIDSVDIYSNSQKSGRNSAAATSREAAYREFLFYTMFHAAERPVIVCEGETDNVYLTHAIRSLASDFPDLAEIEQDGKIRIKVRLFKYPETSTGRLLGLKDGGSSNLAKFIGAYRKETRRFTGPGMTKPVIIAYDNDDGAGPVRASIKQVTKISPDSHDPFTHILKNLYAVPTPLPDGAEASKIEDFFEAETRAVVVNGKTFNDKNNFDTEQHYGKRVFAHRVIRPNADAIDFSGFRPLLTNLVAVINALQAAGPGLNADIPNARAI
jgi:RNA-directed DNA polymerase